MKIVLDTEACKKKGKDVGIVLYLLSLLSGCKITTQTFEKARQQGLLKFEQMYDRRFPFPDYVTVSASGEHLVESASADSSADKTDEEYMELAEKLRELFPAGKKPGYAYTWRDTPSCIAERLKKFEVKYGKHSDDEIIQATKDYVNSFNGNYTYMQLLKYFIWKNKTTGEEVVRGRIVGEVERQSQLAAWIADNKENAGKKHVNVDWDVELR